MADPWPAPTILPKITQQNDCGDYESELAVIIKKSAKNVPESEALDYVLGYTACNDISSRTPQFAQSQWSFSKSFDGACPIGKVSPRYPASVSRLILSGSIISMPLTVDRTDSCLPGLDPRPIKVASARVEERRRASELWNRVRVPNPKYNTINVTPFPA